MYSGGSVALQSINPATNELIKEFNEYSDKEIQEIIEKSHKAFLNWKKLSYEERGSIIKKAGEILLEKKEKYAEILTLEMGKPYTQAVAEVEKCAWVCEYYAHNTVDILKKEVLESDASSSYVRFDPVGVVLAVMPWNFPYWQVFRFASPVLMAGNAALLKHASNVPMSALAIEEIFMEAGLPEGLFATLLIGSKKVESVINHKFVKAATLTGSELAGSKVASACGNKLKKTVMELGGSDPFIVLEDADIREAVHWGVISRMINNGQSCIAAKRFIVVEAVYNEFLEQFTEKMKQIKMGDPMEKDTELGPVARMDLMLELDDQIKRSVGKGANLVLGGKPVEGKGSFYPPTILEVTGKEQPAYNEELFGPAAVIIKARDTDDAIAIANDTEYGLGASIWSLDKNFAEEIAEEIEAGSVFINGMVKSDPRLPFGGIKLSGYGRELSHYGIKEFVNIKTVWVK